MNLKDLGARFDKLKQNERRLILLASVIGLALIGYQLGIDPAVQRNRANRARIEQAQSELSTLQPRLASLREQIEHPDAAMQKDLQDALAQIAVIDKDLRQFDNLLVPPDRMSDMLRSLLARNRNIELVSLKTLPVAPLLSLNDPAAASGNTSSQAQPAQAGAKPPPPPGGIYRHTVEIKVAGSYSDLVRYADELQRISPRPLWSSMTLKVVEYPRSELTFTLYTLSLDLPWLAV